MVARRAGITKAVTRSRPQKELFLPAMRCVLVGDVPPSQGKREPPIRWAEALLVPIRYGAQITSFWARQVSRPASLPRWPRPAGAYRR